MTTLITGTPVLVTGPTQEPIKDDELLKQLKLDGSTEELELIRRYQRAARAFCENRVGCKFLTQTWDVYFDGVPASGMDSLLLPIWPVTSVGFVKYYDLTETQQTWTTSEYSTALIGRRPRIQPKLGYSWPFILDRFESVVVRVVAGFSSRDLVPNDWVMAMLLLIGHWHSNRGAVEIGAITQEIEFGVDALLGKGEVG